MDVRARELLDGMKNIEAQMIQYIKDGASRLPSRILIYEITKDLYLFDHGDHKELRILDRRFYLTPDGEIEEDIKRPMDKEYEKNFCLSSLNSFAETFKTPGLKQAVKVLGEELEKPQSPL